MTDRATDTARRKALLLMKANEGCAYLALLSLLKAEPSIYDKAMGHSGRD